MALAHIGDGNAPLREQDDADRRAAANKFNGAGYKALLQLVDSRPRRAEGIVLTSDLDAAEKEIAPTSLDCDRCVRARGKIAAARRDWTNAARWFALVSARSPQVPFADTERGQGLLAKGDLDGAIEKFKPAKAR